MLPTVRICCSKAFLFLVFAHSCFSFVSFSTETDIPVLSATTAADAAQPESNKGAEVAIAAAAIDDGLGAFRPSTSFSDLTTLLPSADAAAASEKPKQSKKRSAAATGAATTAAPPAKRKSTAQKTATRRVSATGVKKQPVSEGASAKHPGATPARQRSSPRQKIDTPDPLSMTETTVRTSTTVAAPKAPKTAAAASAHGRAGSAAPTSKSSTSSEGDNPEADFKSIAQAAVSNLVMNAASINKTDAGNIKPVDTSSEHIKALTGNNWVAACTNVATETVTPAAPPATDSKANNRARRQNLTPDERARQNRDRNREHARNTRLRKKAYVEELKRTLTELVSQRDAAEFEKRHDAQREIEQREVRFRVIEEFLKLRGRNETNFARWAAILEEGFSLALPLTSYGSTVESGTRTPFDQVLHGVSDVMADSCNFAELFDTLGDSDEKGVVSFQYRCDRSNFFMDGCIAVLEWTGTTMNVSWFLFFSDQSMLEKTCLTDPFASLTGRYRAQPQGELPRQVQPCVEQADVCSDDL